MGARGGKATAGNGGSRKNYYDHSAEAQTNSHRRPRSIGYSQGLTTQGWAAPKEKPAGVNRRAVMCRPIRANESAALRYAARPTLGGEPPARPRWCDQIPTPAENQPADRRARQEQKKSPPGSSGEFETFFGGVSADLEPAPLLSAVPVDCARHTTSAHVVLML
jgi:hypothetical protein